MEKRYYWLKLKYDFLEEKYIKALRRLPSGDSIVLVYIHIMLKCLSTNGLYEFDGVTDTLEEEISLSLDEDLNLVKLTLSALERYRLIERTPTTLYLIGMPVGLIGSESTVTERVRKYREKKKEEAKLLQCNISETNCNTDIDIDKDIEKNIDIDVDTEKELDKEIKEDNKNKETVINKLIELKLLSKEEMEMYPYIDIIFENSSVLTYGSIESCAISVLSRLPDDIKNRYQIFVYVFRKRIKEELANA